MPLLTRVGGAATKTNLIADIKTAFAAANWSSTVLSVADHFSYGYPSGAPTQYINVDFNTGGAGEISCVPSYAQDVLQDFTHQPRGPLDAMNANATTRFNSQTHIRPTPSAMVATWVFYDEPTLNTVSYVHVVIEHSANQFAHLSMGVMEKAGAWTGGAYTCATSAQVNVSNSSNGCVPWHTGLSPASSVGQNWLAMLTTEIGTGTITGAEASGGVGGGALEFLKQEFVDLNLSTSVSPTIERVILQDFVLHGIDSRTGLTPTFPLYCMARADTLNFRVVLGNPIDVRMALNEGLSGGLNILTIGSDTWYVFPHIIAGTDTARFNYTNPSNFLKDSGHQALAYKLIP